MELIEEIKGFVTDVATMCDTELYELSKIDVAIRVMEMIDSHEPEPPTVRPMSELPPNKRNVLFLIGKIHDRENKNLWTFRTGYANTICRPMVYCDNSQFGLSDNWQSYSNGGRFPYRLATITKPKRHKKHERTNNQDLQNGF